jgi:hypothetical protein
MQSDNIIKDDYLNAGTLEVKGDFIQKAGEYYSYGYRDRTNTLFQEEYIK